MAADERGEHRAPFLHDLELTRPVGVEAREVPGEFGRGVSEQEAGVRERLGDRGECWIVVDHLVEVPPRRLDEGDAVGRVVDDLVGRDERARLRGRDAQVFEVREPIGSFGEFGVFAGLRIGRFDFVEICAQRFGLACSCIVRLAKASEFGSIGPPGRERGTVRLERLVQRRAPRTGRAPRAELLWTAAAAGRPGRARRRVRRRVRRARRPAHCARPRRPGCAPRTTPIARGAARLPRPRRLSRRRGRRSRRRRARATDPRPTPAWRPSALLPRRTERRAAARAP